MAARKQQQLLRLLQREAQPFNVNVAHERNCKSGHVKWRLNYHGHTASVVTSNTPSDHRDLANTRANVRRLARQLVRKVRIKQSG